jgi:hypothetical protein
MIGFIEPSQTPTLTEGGFLQFPDGENAISEGSGMGLSAAFPDRPRKVCELLLATNKTMMRRPMVLSENTYRDQL